jgi:hypothetical protein
MKKISVLVSIGVVFAALGCSRDSQKPAVAPTPVVAASTSPVPAMAAALPVPSVEKVNGHVWRSDNIQDHLGDSTALKATSLDGKFDLVILQKGSHSFLSLVRHARWESVHNNPAKGRLMYLRAKFEDGVERRIEWDELGFATENLYSVLWSYPAKTDAPIGPAPEGSTADSTGGDELLVQDMLNHKTMLLEVEPGVTTQFNVTGLAHEMGKVRIPRARPVLAASQTTD